ncbi:MAG: hypothetical protein Q9225_003942 [Loekoesia sp. 1 TL-2023]
MYLVSKPWLYPLYPTQLGQPNMTLYQGSDAVEYKDYRPGAAFKMLGEQATSWYANGVPPNISMKEVVTNTQRTLLIEAAQLSFSNAWNLTEHSVNRNICIIINRTTEDKTTITTKLNFLTIWDLNKLEVNPNVALTATLTQPVLLAMYSLGKINTVKQPMLVSTDTASIHVPVI